jgi:iron complex outermembrane receptor protein
VINVLSSPAWDTQGLAITAGGGNEQRVIGSMRYGGSLGEDGWFRVYADYRDRDQSALSNGDPAGDSWRIGHAGFRYDRRGEHDTLMLKAEVHSGDFDQPGLVPSEDPPFLTTRNAGDSDGGYVQGRWLRTLGGGGTFSIDAWYDSYRRDLRSIGEHRETFDVDLRHRLRPTPGQDLIWGLGYRNTRDEVEPNFLIAMLPERRTLELWSLYLQDEIALAADLLSLTLGVRVEHNDYTGWETQPNVRLSWTPSDRQTIWAAAGRAVRTPSRINEDATTTSVVFAPGLFGPGSPATLQQTVGNGAVESETLLAWELGWRMRIAGDLTLDVATFYNDYDRLLAYQTLALDTVTLAPRFWRIASQPTNEGAAHAYGAEVAALWQPFAAWRLRAQYSYLDLDFDAIVDRVSQQLAGSSPQHQASVRSLLSIADGWQLDATLRYVGELPSLDIPDYVSADLRIARRWPQGYELALVGQNLWEARHAEFRSAAVPVATEVERGVYVEFSWRQ